MATVGVHYVLELFSCPESRLDDPSFIESTLEGASEVARATLLKKIAHRFEPQGVTALALLAESHISIHTWPEHGYAAADIFTCGTTCQPEKACEFLIKTLEAGSHVIKRIERGTRIQEQVALDGAGAA